MSTATNHVVKMARLSKEVLVGAYRMVYMSRRVDDKEIQLKRQNRAFFQISGVGHETIGVAVALHSAAGLRLVLSLLSRSRALPPIGRDSLRDVLWVRSGAEDDPASGGRQMPSHWSIARGSTLVSSPVLRARKSCRPWAPPKASQYFSW